MNVFWQHNDVHCGRGEEADPAPETVMEQSPRFQICLQDETSFCFLLLVQVLQVPAEETTNRPPDWNSSVLLSLFAVYTSANGHLNDTLQIGSTAKPSQMSRKRPIFTWRFHLQHKCLPTAKCWSRHQIGTLPLEADD
jgi:hypothetical protein